MFRLVVIPVSVGILVFVCIYFVSPAFVQAPDTVAYVAESILYWSNSFFATMPPILASYVAYLDLATIALTAGLISLIGVHLVILIGGALIGLAKWMVAFVLKDRSKDDAEDLPPIEMDSRYMRDMPGKEIMGRGIDSMDRE